MPTYTKVVGLAVAALVVVLGGAWLLGPRPGPLVGSSPAVPTPSASPTASPAPSSSPAGPQTSAFTSPLYGYRVAHPAAYQVTAATERWQADDIIEPQRPWVDQFLAPNGAAFVGIASQPLPAEMDADAWMADYASAVEASRECGGPAVDWVPATVAGTPGRRLDFTCDGAPAVDIVWVIGRIGWVASGQPAVIELMLESFQEP